MSVVRVKVVRMMTLLLLVVVMLLVLLLLLLLLLVMVVVLLMLQVQVLCRLGCRRALGFWLSPFLYGVPNPSDGLDKGE